MKILKASAGSGKTYELSHTYIDLLMDSDDRYAYRHILAVTFTNKATAEMKARILKDLSALAKDNKKAESLLTDILHDYSAFAVSTIDKFFQQTLKAFSREIGQFSSYQIELDRKSLIQEAMDRILDSLTEDQKELVSWIKDSVMEKVEKGERFSIDEGLYDVGMLLKNEEFRELSEKYGMDGKSLFSKQRLKSIESSCNKVIGDFENKAREAGLSVTAGEAVKMPGKRELSKNPELSELFNQAYDIYNTALTLKKLTFSLGLASEFYKCFDELIKEKNVMPLEDSNTILRDIIDGSDAPFVYEKTGVRYEHFLLDEFQDTSRIQWANFLPLLKESESHSQPGKLSNLIVGDVKQSIYRWRDSDWKLLGEEVGKEFPEAESIKMKFNWRSCRAIVDFNNRFFEFAARKTDSKLYDDVEQEAMSKDLQEGCVQVSFVDDPIEEVMESVRQARNCQALWRDIAVLVRSRNEGSMIASRFIEEGWPVISDDSLCVKSSPVVRRLVSLLSYMDNPSNSAGAYLARDLKLESCSSHHSLLDLCETLLRTIINDRGDGSIDGETLFIQAFMDEVRNWTDINGNNIRSFLKHWEEVDPTIGSPQNADSIRILTIHKSKGLEFPYVIFPFAEEVSFFKHGTHWCLLNGGGTALGDGVTGLYPVHLSKKSSNSLFRGAMEQEVKMQITDNINVFYVALTRAAKSMHIISSIPSKTFRDKLDRDVQEYSNFSEILYSFCGKASNCIFGKEYDFSLMERDVPDRIESFPGTYTSIAPGGRVRASEDAYDFFGENGLAGSAASARLSGIEMHKILEKLGNPSKLPSWLDADKRALLEERIAAHPEWFNGNTVRNEQSIIDTKGREYRPDKVIINGDSAFVLDYKFGSEQLDSHVEQVRKYMTLYSRMGWKDVKGAVWYVVEDKVVNVTL